jgi:tetratricopeptide (TPR) repeat protein
VTRSHTWRRRRLLWMAICAAAVSCSAPALLNDLAEAERYERAGEHERALAAYEAAQTSCRHIRQKRLRRDTCAQAHIGRAELLEELGRIDEAAVAYEATPAALARDPIPSGKATYRAGRLRLDMGKEERGYALLWKAITDYPDVVYAVDALQRILQDGRQRNPAQLYGVLGELVAPLAGNEVSDNILLAMAELAEKDFRHPKRALSHYDQIVAEYRDGGLYDEALWHGARLARATGDPRGAAKRLRMLLATREVSLHVGSYFSVWLDNAQLELGKILRDDLRDPRAAIRAFRQLPRDYPASILQDDAVFETAVAWELAGEVGRACEALAHLRAKWPDSKYELELGPALRRKLGCPESRL